jgi:CarD family transcriptional regulator
MTKKKNELPKNNAEKPINKEKDPKTKEYSPATAHQNQQTELETKTKSLLVATKSNEELAISQNKKQQNNGDFQINDSVIYPAHGVGKIIDIEEMSIQEKVFSFYIIIFEKEKLTIKVPVTNIKDSGLRPLSNKKQFDEVFTILRSGIKKIKGMWSRRAQEYEVKINSGDIKMIAEVVRDLTRDIDDNERSYSERIIYEGSIYRLASEYSAIAKIDFEEAKTKIINTAKDKIDTEHQQIRTRKQDDFDFDEFLEKEQKKGKNSGKKVSDEDSEEFDTFDFDDEDAEEFEEDLEDDKENLDEDYDFKDEED